MNGPLSSSRGGGPRNSANAALAEAALEYAARGWAVFPLRPRDKIPMIGPSKPGRHDGGFHLATKDAEQIAAWWTKWPDANIGLRCGEESGVFVLDLDGPGAEAALGTLQGRFGALPDTLAQRTGKGRHLLFRHVAGVRNRGGGYLDQGKRVQCPGFDVRGEGGYIVLPPSVHPSGRLYQWTNSSLGGPRNSANADAAIADAPGWLIEAIVPPPPKPAAPMQPYKGEGRATAYGEKALESACRRIATAQHGTRHNTLSSEAASIGELVAGGEIQRTYAERALVTAATAMMAGAVTQRELSKISWGLGVGQSRPRRITRERQEARRVAGCERITPARANDIKDARFRLAISPSDESATLIVATEDIAERAAMAWEAAHGGPYGLFVPRDLKTLAGELAVNAGGFPDWRLPRPDLARPAPTMRWRGRVLVVLPADLQGFTVSKGTKFERFISAERHAQVLGLLATHWWKHAGASDVQVAALPAEAEAA